MVRFIFAILLLASCGTAFGSPDIILGWRAISFTTTSGYHIEIETNDNGAIDRLQIRHDDVEISIPKSDLIPLKGLSIREASLSEGVRGRYATLEIPQYIFDNSDGPAEKKRVWAISLRDGLYDGISSRVEPADECIDGL